MKLYTIKDLREGRCAIKNDGTKQELEAVTQEAFGEGAEGVFAYYFRPRGNKGYDCSDNTDLPSQSAKLFLGKPELEIRMSGSIGFTIEEYSDDFADFYGTKQYNMWMFIMKQIDFSGIKAFDLADALKDFAKNFSYTWDGLRDFRSPMAAVICGFPWDLSGLGDEAWNAIDEAYKAMIRDLNLHDEYSTPWKKC